MNCVSRASVRSLIVMTAVAPLSVCMGMTATAARNRLESPRLAVSSAYRSACIRRRQPPPEKGTC